MTIDLLVVYLYTQLEVHLVHKLNHLLYCQTIIIMYNSDIKLPQIGKVFFINQSNKCSVVYSQNK